MQGSREALWQGSPSVQRRQACGETSMQEESEDLW